MKRPFLLLVCLFFIGFTYSQTVVDLYDNDFDSYTSGDYISVVDPDWWLPWGGTPGAGDDAMVSDAEANTAPNSIVVDEVGGATDVVWELGDKTTGKFWAGWYMFVQSGFEGYYNFQKTEIPGTEWAFEIFFYTDGTAELELDQTVVASFTYTPDSWFYMDHMIDLDNDMAEMWFDGTLVHSWAWSNGGLLQLGGVDFYAGTNVAYYVDDVNYDQVFDPIYCDDFDSYTAGQWIAEENPDYWMTWGNAPGTPEDGLITDVQAYSAPNSVAIEDVGGATDLVLKLGDKTSGSFEVDWYMYIPSGNQAYYNFQKTETPGTEWACDLYFYDDGSAEFQIDQTVLATFTFTPDSWFLMHHVIDLDNDMAECYIDGTLIHSWAWSNGGLLQLGGVDFYTIDDTYVYYFDDLCFIQTGGSNDPAITVTPDIYQKILAQGESEVDVLNIENTGGADLVYDVAVVYNVTKDQTTLPDPKPLSRKLSPSDFEVVPSNGGATGSRDVTLNWDGDNATSVGLTAPGDWEAAAMFPSSMIQQYAGMELSSVDVYINDPDPADAFEVRVYGKENDMVSGPLLYSQAFTPTIMSWNTVTFDTPLVIDGQDIWIAIWVDQTTLTHPIGGDAGPANMYGDYIKTGAAWGHLAPGIDANWNIRGTLTGTAMHQWLTIDPYAGTVAPGNIDQLDATFDAGSMDAGTYQATIYVQSNANQTPIVSVPATLVVTPGGGQMSECMDFESLTAWSQDLSPWMGIDVDGGATWGATDFDFPGEGDPMAYIVFNPDLTDPPMTGDPALAPHSGSQYGADFATMPPPFNDDWLISPQVTLGDNPEFNFWVKSYTDAYGLERYNVAISTTGNDPADFTLLNTGGYLEAPLDWDNQVWDLSAYVGEDVYLAIQCVTEDAFIFMVDDICVNWTVGVDEVAANQEVFIYPNPTTSHFNIDATSTIKEIRVFNYTGQLVDSKIGENKFETIYTSTYKAGIYFIQVHTVEGVSTQKVVIK